jgi:hypothetical protein
MVDIQKQAVTGVIPPQSDEALIRERYPTIARFPAVAALGRFLTSTIILAPLAWLLFAPFFFSKVLPITGRRYILTNRRLMIRRFAVWSGWKGEPVAQVLLADIDEIRVKTDANSDFFRSGTMEILSKGKVVLTLPGCQEPDSFRVSILNACAAWVKDGAKLYPFVAANAK